MMFTLSHYFSEAKISVKVLEWDRSSQCQHHYAQKPPESNHAPHVHEDISLLELALI